MDSKGHFLKTSLLKEMVRRNESPKFASLVTGRGEILSTDRLLLLLLLSLRVLFHSWMLGTFIHEPCWIQGAKSWRVIHIHSNLCAQKDLQGWKEVTRHSLVKILLRSMFTCKVHKKSISDLGGDESDSELRNWLFLKLLGPNDRIIAVLFSRISHNASF